MIRDTYTNPDQLYAIPLVLNASHGHTPDVISHFMHTDMQHILNMQTRIILLFRRNAEHPDEGLHIFQKNLK